MRNDPALIAFLARDLENSCCTGDIQHSKLSSLLLLWTFVVHHRQCIVFACVAGYA